MLVRALLKSHKINPFMILELPNLLNSTNQLIDIQKDMRKCPVGTWDYKLGEWGAKLVSTLILQTLITAKLVDERDYNNIGNKMMIEANKVQSHFRDHRLWAKKITLA
jgi:hypothetical protein